MKSNETISRKWLKTLNLTQYEISRHGQTDEQTTGQTHKQTELAKIEPARFFSGWVEYENKKTVSPERFFANKLFSVNGVT